MDEERGVGHSAAGRAALATLVLTLLLVVLAPGSAQAAAASPDDLPTDAPPAAHRPEPSLPTPDAWPFSEAFPRTSGFGRVADHAYFWSDFLYDDNGAITGLPPENESPGAVSFGSYRYPEDEAANNGADIFRVAVGLDDDGSWWRVDWNTLEDPALPIAAFALDTDADTATGVTAWPAGAGIRSAGLEHALVVSGTGAWLVDLAGGTSVPVADVGGRHEVDTQSRSFLVHLPSDALAPSGEWTVRVAAGLADAHGDGFRALGPEHGALPGGANVFNVGFRAHDDEPMVNNFWRDMTQATALAARDVSDFAATIDWGVLASGAPEPEPLPTGASNRWYVSSVELGPGIVAFPGSTGDGEPTYLGRVQPYTVYIPTTYRPGEPVPLTFVLHSFTINHNQYTATTPRFLQQACEDRGAICVTTLQRGPDGNYRGAGELDFWEVWREVAAIYDLDPERTTIGGYSMGGFGTVRLMLNHPDLFAAAFLIASAAGDDIPRLENARWLPYYHAHGALDELVPLPEAEATIDELDRLGYRYTFDLYPAEDHVLFSLKDSYRPAAEFLAENHHREQAPGEIIYSFFPSEVDDGLGIGPRGAWWLRDVVADDPDAELARVVALTSTIPVPNVTPVRTQEPRPGAEPSPAIRRRLMWEFGPVPAPPPQPTITLEAQAVGAARVDLARARFDTRADGATIEVTTDAVLELTLSTVAADVDVLLDGRLVSAATDVAAHVTVAVPRGDHVITFALVGGGGTSAGPTTTTSGSTTGTATAGTGATTSATSGGDMPSTGGGAGLAAVALLALSSLAARRRVARRTG